MRSLILNEDARVRPICLPEETCSSSRQGGEGSGMPSCLMGRQAMLAGWGLLHELDWTADTDEEELNAKTVHHVTVPIIGNQQCADDYAKNDISILNTMICAGLPEGGKDTCQVG